MLSWKQVPLYSQIKSFLLDSEGSYKDMKLQNTLILLALLCATLFLASALAVDEKSQDEKQGNVYIPYF